MGWSHIYCILAGLWIGAWLTSVWNYEKPSDDPIRLADGWWLPKAKGPPPPAPPAPPPVTSRHPETRLSRP